MYLTWLIIIVFLTIIEISTVSLVSIWFVISGIFALIASFFTESLLIQFGIFVIGGVLLLIFTRDFVKKLLNKKGNERTNSDRVIGMTGIVTEKVTKTKPGEVKVDGKKWTAVSNKTLNVDEEVKVLEIDGVKLKVERSDEK